MPKLRNSVINRIINSLEYGDYCLEDFDVNFPEDSSVLAEIVFKALPKFSYTLDEEYPGGAIGSALRLSGQNVKKAIRTIESPGEYKNNEQRNHNDIDSAIQRVSDWVRNIREDIINSKSAFRVTTDDLTEEFQNSIDEAISDPDAYFEDSEEDEIRKKLDELQLRVSVLEKKLEIGSEESEKISKAIEKSKADLKVYPKGIWYKTAGTKILRTLRDALKTKEGREFLSEMTKKLLTWSP